MIYIGVIPDITNIKFLTNMVVYCIIKCRRFDESISSNENIYHLGNFVQN